MFNLSQDENTSSDNKISRRPFARRRKKYKTLASNWARHATLSLLLLIYAFIGAAIFHAIEFPKQVHDFTTRREANAARRLEYAKIWTDRMKASNSCREHLHIEAASNRCTESAAELLAEFERALKVGVPDDLKYTWDFWNAMFYATTVFTTIGYGNMHCTTRAGQLVTMVYALIGVPLMLTVLNDIAGVLYMHLSHFYASLRRRLKLMVTRRSREATRVVLKRGESISSTETHNSLRIPVTAALSFLLLYILFCGAIFRLWESQWDYFTSCYFIFVSLTTIGLGDVAPERPAITVFAFAFIIVGLAMVSMYVTALQHNVRAWFDWVFDKLQAKPGLDTVDALAQNALVLRGIGRMVAGRHSLHMSGSTLGILQACGPTLRPERSVQTDDFLMQEALLFKYVDTEEGSSTLSINAFPKCFSRETSVQLTPPEYAESPIHKSYSDCNGFRVHNHHHKIICSKAMYESM